MCVSGNHQKKRRSAELPASILLRRSLNPTTFLKVFPALLPGVVKPAGGWLLIQGFRWFLLQDQRAWAKPLVPPLVPDSVGPCLNSGEITLSSFLKMPILILLSAVLFSGQLAQRANAVPPHAGSSYMNLFTNR